VTSSARIPSGIVLLNGTQVPWLEWSVNNNGYYSPDKFAVTLPVSALPSGFQRADLADMAQIMLEVRAALDGGAPVSLVIGRVDDIEDDLVDGIIHLTGRDRTADFIEAKTTEKFANQTSSQIVQTLAARHGLTANAQSTTTKVGKYYEVDHDKLTDNITEWDLITYLAQKEGFVAYVTGTVLNFQPDTTASGTPIPIVYTPAQNGQPASGPFTRAAMKRSLTLASDVVVNVYSWNHKSKQAFKVTATATKTGAKSSGPTQTYTFRFPGLTKDQAQAIAQQRAEDITRHERLFEYDAPGDLTTTAQSQVQLSGTGTAYDQTYWVAEIERRMSFGEGFEMTVKTKNHSPQSTVTA
jgi:phage protein D